MSVPLARAAHVIRSREEILADLVIAAAELDAAHATLDRLRVPRLNAYGARYAIVNRLAWWVLTNGETKLRAYWLEQEA